MKDTTTTKPTELRCSGCQMTHPVEAFGVNRSTKRGYQGSCRVAQAKHQRTPAGIETRRKAEAKYDATPARKEAKAKYNRTPVRIEEIRKYHAKIDQRAHDIVGHVCAWHNLDGCEGEMQIDHIMPPGQRRTTGYTSHGSALNRWIISHPAEAKKRLQPLCAKHNGFKNTYSDTEGRARWVARYPKTLALSLTITIEQKEAA